MLDFAIDNYLRISWQDVLLVCISSALIVLIVRKFFWNKLFSYMDRRKAAIQTEVTDARKLKEEAMELKASYQKQIDGAGKEAAAIISQAKDEAGLQKERIIDSAKQEAANIEQSAREQIEAEKKQAEQSMKSAIADVAMAAAASLLQEEMDDDRQKQLVDQFIDSKGDEAWKL